MEFTKKFIKSFGLSGIYSPFNIFVLLLLLLKWTHLYYGPACFKWLASVGLLKANFTVTQEGWCTSATIFIRGPQCQIPAVHLTWVSEGTRVLGMLAYFNVNFPHHFPEGGPIIGLVFTQIPTLLVCLAKSPWSLHFSYYLWW